MQEPGESDEQALIRKIQEELSVSIVSQTIRPFGVFEGPAHGHPEGTRVTMTPYRAEYEGVLSPSAEIAELQWLRSIDADRISTVDRIIF